ncbi:MAG: hypothetical protein HS115_05780 [Spirochaetales bacterium]|nr:hypothetical protein [Spirochaetales bacterium]
MTGSLFRSFFWAVILASAIAWVYLGIVISPAREAILIEDSVLGLSPEVVRSGEWRFVPERAFPDRILLHRVYTGRRNLHFHFKAPAGQTEFLALDDTFQVQIQLELAFGLIPDRLTQLFVALGSDGFGNLDLFIESRLQHLLEKELASRFDTPADLEDLGEDLEAFLLSAECLRLFNGVLSPYGIEMEEVFIKKMYVPPADSYRRALARSDEIIDSRLRQAQAASEDLMRSRVAGKKDEYYFARLEKMGGLLRRFPELREYLAIDKLSEQVDVMVVPYDRWSGERQKPPLPEKAEATPPERRRVLPEFGLPGGFRDLTPP